MTQYNNIHTTHRPRKRKWIYRLFFLCLIIIAAAFFGVVFVYLSLRQNLPSVEQILHRRIAQSTKIYDRTGEILLYEMSGDERRTVVSLTDIPLSLQNATITVEDEGFYNEPAFDWKAIVRSLIVNLRNRTILQGGSTITQQLAKNAFLSPEQTITRKLKELILAMDLNRQYTKKQILELYLNEIPYGPTAYGVEAASQTFFGKPVTKITLAEAAVLATLPKAPTYYSPWGSHRDELLARQKSILKKMRNVGNITEGEYQEARTTSIAFAPQGQTIKAPHFVMLVQDYLTQKYGEDLARRGGLRVITALDWDLQELAERVVKSGAERNEALYGGANASLVAQDPSTGQILAMVGSRDYFDEAHEGNFNVATQGLRQPGSALKPFVYLTAFEKGYTPQTVLFDVPTEFSANNPNCPPIPAYETELATSTPISPEEPSGCFHPQNFDKKFRGPISLREALALSRNVPSVKLLYLAGMSDVITNARRFGIETLASPATYGLSLVLGGGAVHLADLVGAYSTLAADGVRHARVYIREVRDSAGSIIESYRDNAEQIAPPQAVRLVNSILTDVEARRGLFGGSTSYTTLPDRDVALKTGTSQDFRDAWAIGYTPSLAVGVWAGNNDNTPMHRNGSSIFAAVPIWHDFFSAAHATRNFPIETFPSPDPVAPENPILAGDYLATGELHSILYFIDRNNPTGQAPADPAGNPQFTNWETGLLAWAAQNIPNAAGYYKLPADSSLPVGITRIDIELPKNGSVVRSASLAVFARIASARGADEIRIRLNGQIIDSIRNAFPSSTPFAFARVIPIVGIQPQNLLEIEARAGTESLTRSQVIFYQQ